MTRRLQPALLATALSIALLATGCGTTSRQAATPPAGNASAKLSLATSVATTSRNWAVLVVGDSADSTNDFWQLLARPATGGTWRLVTPPGVASNGGLVVAPTGTSSLLAGFLPSQELRFTPLATTANAGSNWSAGVLNAHLADTPDALAADPGTGKVLALLADGTLRQSTNGGKAWSTIATRQSVAKTQAGHRCDLTQLTGTAFSPSGDPMLAGSCSTHGQAGIFTLTSGTWQPSNPSVPADQPVTTLSISASAGSTQALLAIGDGATASLVAARYAGDPARWTLSQPFTVGSEKVLSVSTGSNGTTAVLLSGRAGLLLAGAAADWQRLPGLPPATQALTAGPGSELQALTAGRTTVGIWTLNDSRSGWTQVQHLPVPVQFGSSG
ncbi:MAG TPA: hypothetical protein VFI65_21850 [Streptosporangiaceae bacterium]|nr:hypothetical protein [Streptosporangiaceae bacterium]